MNNWYYKEINLALNSSNSHKADIINYYDDKEEFIKDWTNLTTLENWNISNDELEEWKEALNLIWDEKTQKQNLSQK